MSPQVLIELDSPYKILDLLESNWVWEKKTEELGVSEGSSTAGKWEAKVTCGW